MVLVLDSGDSPAGYEGLGLEVWPAELRVKGNGVCDLCRTRWLAWAALLETVDPETPVACVDVRDAVFQAPPEGMVEGRLIVGAEITLHTDSMVAMYWAQVFAPGSEERVKDKPVLCAGVLGGPAKMVRELAIEVYRRLKPIRCVCLAGQSHMGDQAIVNDLAYGEWKDRFDITTDWVLHCIGKMRIVPTTPEGVLLNDRGFPYAIVHQYDRIPELNQRWNP